MRGEECGLVEELPQCVAQVVGADHGDEHGPSIADLAYPADQAPARLQPTLSQARESLAEPVGRVGGRHGQPHGGEQRDQARDRLHPDMGGLARRQHEPVVEEPVVGVVEALLLERPRDQHELLEELDHHVLVDDVLLGDTIAITSIESV